MSYQPVLSASAGSLATMETTDIQQTKLFRVIRGAIVSAIDAHGPITKENVGSAAKRVASSVRAEGTDE